MQIRLRIVHGQFQSKQGTDAGAEIAVSKLPFLIGSGSDCQLRCKSSQVSEHHCQLLLAGRQLHVRDLGSQTGTYVNGETLHGSGVLHPGDHLTVGRLEFELLFDPSELETQPLREQPADPVGDEVSEILLKADEAERLKRQFDPQARKFQVEAKPPAPEPQSAVDQRMEQLRKQKKKPPGKLPPRPGIVAPDSVNAADEALKRMLKKKS